MSIWTRERYAPEVYLALYRSLRANNKYQYGVVLSSSQGVAQNRDGFRSLALPEGILVLSQKAVRGYGLQEIKEKPIYLTFFTLVWDEKRKRIRLQINRDYVRLQLKRARDYSRRQSWGARRKSVREYLKQVNDLTRELKEISKVCFVYPETKRAYNTKLRQIVLTYLTTVQGLSKFQALQTIKKYLVRF